MTTYQNIIEECKIAILKTYYRYYFSNITSFIEVKMSLYGDEDVIIKEKESQVAGWSQVSTLSFLKITFELSIIGRAGV